MRNGFKVFDPDIQAALVRAYNRWGQEMRETSPPASSARS